MTFLWTQYETGYTEDEDCEAKEQVFSCSKCKRMFLACIEMEDDWGDEQPVVELLLCMECSDKFDPSNLYLIWMDWNAEQDTLH
tara:strand:- start:1347 stop:1598 length:252 start_codon:yes stop_codon:yes gene_type:complete